MNKKYVPLLILLLSLPMAARAADLEAEPIRYSKTTPNDAISRLQAKLDKGQVKLARDDKFGYLKAVLRELQVPESSQTLVFSRTSVQRHRIAPRTPRAIYFNDDIYIGYCQQGDVLEISSADPRLGTMFWTLNQAAADKPRFERQGNVCLICHASSQNQGMPGHLNTSGYYDSSGEGVRLTDFFTTSHASPLAQRWGGWYVTGKSGTQGHLGNLIVRGRVSSSTNQAARINATDLSKWLDTSAYLASTSDIVALMVLDHQTEMHNRIVRAGMLTRIALHEDQSANPGRKTLSAVTQERISSAVEPLVKYLLFADEVKLTDRIEGTSGFAAEFAGRGPRDGQKRSLREFDLKRRLFKYPCSYLIYSPAFDALPALVKDQVWKRLGEILTGKDTSPTFAHLSPADRRAILEILKATKPGVPASWKQ